MAEALESIRNAGILPVLVISEAGKANALGAALKAGGLSCLEVTFRTPPAAESLRRLAADPDLLVGAGTVLTCEQVDDAVKAGARFIVTPGFSLQVVRHCQEIGVPIFPGVATASEIGWALEAGIDTLKFFPAEQLGGLATIKALSGPFPTVKFIPTGGVTASSVTTYLAGPSVLAVGGSWMATPGLTGSGATSEITRLAREAVQLVASVRTESETATYAAPGWRCRLGGRSQ